MEVAIVDKDVTASRIANVRLALTRRSISPNQAYVSLVAEGMAGDKATELVESVMRKKPSEVKPKAVTAVHNGGFVY